MLFVGVVKEYTEYYSTLEAVKGFEDSRSKDNITCVYRSHIFNGVVNELGRVICIEMQRFFPHELLRCAYSGNIPSSR